MIKEVCFSAYIIPVRDGCVAMVRYGANGYGPIGGRLDNGEDFKTALRRELTEELGDGATALMDNLVEIPVPYSFRHTDVARAEKRGAYSEEHHFFVAHMPSDIDLQFVEKRDEDISVVWLDATDLLHPEITPIADMADFYATHILPNLSCRFSMSLQHTYYDMIKSGDKDIELRLYDEKRRKMRNNDIVLLYDVQNPSDYMKCKIVRLHIAKSFADLATKISFPRTGFLSLDKLMSAISKFYDSDMESKYGIVGIELEIIL